MTAPAIPLVPFELTLRHERDKHAHFADKTRVLDWHEMEGKTIRYVCDSPSGKEGSAASAVLVFDDFTWAAIVMDGSGEDASISLDDWYSRKLGAADIMSPMELWQAGLVNDTQRDYLAQKTTDMKRVQAQEKADVLRKLAQQIEDAAPLPRCGSRTA
jgi:hypothetical protein